MNRADAPREGEGDRAVLRAIDPFGLRDMNVLRDQTFTLDWQGGAFEGFGERELLIPARGGEVNYSVLCPRMAVTRSTLDPPETHNQDKRWKCHSWTNM